jgi:hypothetical protein
LSHAALAFRAIRGPAKKDEGLEALCDRAIRYANQLPNKVERLTERKRNKPHWGARKATGSCQPSVHRSGIAGFGISDVGLDARGPRRMDNALDRFYESGQPAEMFASPDEQDRYT